MKRTLAGILLLMGICFISNAQPVPEKKVTEKEASDSAMIFFHLAKYDIDLDFEDNRAQMERVMQTLEKAIREGKVEKIAIKATASPDGSYEFNATLSQNRANAIMSYITERCPVPEHKTEAIAGGIAWDWLLKWAQKSDLAEKDEIIRIISEEPEVTYDAKGKAIDNRKNCLRNLNGGKTYKYLYDNVFPQMRSGAALYIYLFPVPEDQMPQYLAEQAAMAAATELAAASAVAASQEEEIDVQTVQEAQAKDSKFYMGVKTNLLYDALLVPNIGVEFYLDKGWALGLMYQNSWWNGRSQHNWWRVQNVELEARKYFGNLASLKPMQGHHLGAYVNWGKYDCMFSGTTDGNSVGILPDKILSKASEYGFIIPFQSGVGRMFNNAFGIGVSYGYSLPIAKRLNLDFEIAVGALVGKGYDYVINPDKGQVSSDNPVYSNLNEQCNTTEWYYKTTQEPKTLWYVGPTKLAVTLVYLIGAKNYNLK